MVSRLRRFVVQPARLFHLPAVLSRAGAELLAFGVASGDGREMLVLLCELLLDLKE